MTCRYVIGVDLGTQGSKGVLVSDEGQIVASHSIEQTISTPRPGWAEQDAESAWWGGFVQVVKALLFQSQVNADDIDAVGVSSLMPVMLPVDREGRPLRPAILYADTRADAELVEINRYLQEYGDPPVIAHDAGPKIVWFRDHEPARWRRTHAILGAQGYVIGKLTGRYVVDSVTALGYRPFVHGDGLTWHAEHCDHFGVPAAFLPDLVEMTSVIGVVNASAAAETGLAIGTRVMGGATDFVAEMVSTGAHEAGDVVVTYGTTLCLVVLARLPESDNPDLGATLLQRGGLTSLYPDLCAFGGGMATSGALTRWFRDHFGQHERWAEQQLGISAYGLLGLEAEATPPGAEGLIVLPYFSGERSPIYDGQARGCIFGLTLAHGRGHVYRALLEGVAYSLQHNLALIAQTGTPLRRIVATGGGSRSQLWTQIVSDVTGLPQVVIAPSNAALGAAFLAGYAHGMFSGLEDVRQWARVEREVQPRKAVHDVYQEYFAIYRRLYTQTKEEMHALAQLTGEKPRAREALDLVAT